MQKFHTVTLSALAILTSNLVAHSASAALPATQPRLSRAAWDLPTGGRFGKSIPVAVHVVCFSSTSCPRAQWGEEVSLTPTALSSALATANKDFTYNGSLQARFALSSFRKVVDPQLFNTVSSDPLTLLDQRYKVAGKLNIYIVNSMPYAGLGWVDRTLGQHPSLVITADSTNAKNYVYLQHEILHNLGAQHAADGTGPVQMTYAQTACNSQFNYTVQDSATVNSFQTDSAGYLTGCTAKYRNFMSYGGLTVFPASTVELFPECSRPTAFTNTWFYDSAVKSTSVGSTVVSLPATYGHAYRTIMKCWNYRNFK